MVDWDGGNGFGDLVMEVVGRVFDFFLFSVEFCYFVCGGLEL